jgi:excisionase family DNA binding protein
VLIKEEIGKHMANEEQMDDMLTVREVARLLHVHPNTLRRWSNNGRIRAYRITPRGDRRFKREEIARFLAELSQATDSVGIVHRNGGNLSQSPTSFVELR